MQIIPLLCNAIDSALARLALAAMEQKDEVSRLRLRESWVVKVLGSRPIFQALMKLGWLNRVERLPEAICVFYHATFQEYFAALAVDNWDDFLPENHVDFPVAGKEYRIFEPQWKQVILLWLGREDVADRQKEGFITALVEFEDGCGGFYKFQAYFLAALGLAEFENNNNELVEKTIIDLIICSFGKFDEEQQVWHTFPDEISNLARITLCNTNLKKAFNLLENWSFDFYSLKQIIPEQNLTAKKFFNQLSELVSQILEEIESKLTHKKQKQCHQIEIQFDCLIENIQVNFSEFDLNKSKDLTKLLDLVYGSNDEDIIVKFLFALEQLRDIKKEVIDALCFIMNTSDNDRITWLAASTLLQLKFHQDKALNKLIILLTQSLDEFSRYLAAGSLLDLKPKNYTLIEQIINTLLHLLCTGNSDIRFSIVNILKWKLQNKQMSLVITALKQHLTSNVYEQDLDLYSKCYTLLWQYAENLTYLEFYQAYHGLTET